VQQNETKIERWMGGGTLAVGSLSPSGGKMEGGQRAQKKGIVLLNVIRHISSTLRNLRKKNKIGIHCLLALHEALQSSSWEHN